MIIFDPGAGEVLQWVVCFSKACATLPWLPIGKYKHVRAFGLVSEINTWVFFDPRLEGLTIKLARGDAAGPLIHEFLYQADLIQMPARQQGSKNFPLFGWCAPQVAHLLGLPGALRPDTLFRHCLRANGHTLAAATAAA